MSTSKNSGALARASTQTTRRRSPPASDFDRYMLSEDAQQAEFWHLQALCGLRQAMGEQPLSQSGYEQLRAILIAEVRIRRFR